MRYSIVHRGIGKQGATWMNFDRFKKIIEYNRLHMNEITECIRDFYSKLGSDCEK